MERENRAGLTPGEGRRFGLTVGGAFLVLAAFSWWRGHEIPSAVLGGFGLTLSVAALTIPGRLGPVQDAWMRLAVAISRVTTPIVLGILYFFVFTPIGLLLRVSGRDPLKRTEIAGSFWVDRPEDSRRGNLERQF